VELAFVSLYVYVVITLSISISKVAISKNLAIYAEMVEGKEVKRALSLTEEEHEFLDLVGSLTSAYSTVDLKRTA